MEAVENALVADDLIVTGMGDIIERNRLIEEALIEKNAPITRVVWWAGMGVGIMILYGIGVLILDLIEAASS